MEVRRVRFRSACGGDDGGDDVAETTELSDTGSSNGLDTDNPFTLGLVLSSSGPIGVVGPQSLLGAEAAVKELNEGGGILGREVRIVPRDSKHYVHTDAFGAREIVDNEEPHYKPPAPLLPTHLDTLPTTPDKTAPP